MGYENYRIEKSELNDLKKTEEYMLVEQWCHSQPNYSICSDDIYVWVQKNPEQTQEQKEQEVRAIRDLYLIVYVDNQFKNILMWNEMEESKQQEIQEYRRYLLDYTATESWFEAVPLDFKAWKENKGK